MIKFCFPIHYALGVSVWLKTKIIDIVFNLQISWTIHHHLFKMLAESSISLVVNYSFKVTMQSSREIRSALHSVAVIIIIIYIFISFARVIFNQKH